MDTIPPKVSVLIATFNKSAALKYAIDSVLWQTFGDYELWVIGDGCTDDSAEVVASYGDSRVQWHNLSENTGYQSEPHNEGLRRSKGKYIAYLNHDDMWLPNHLQVLVECADRTSADFVYSILEWILTWRESYPDIPHYPDAPLPPEATATLHRREVVDDLGYWKQPSETYAVPRAEYFRRAQFAGKKFEFVPALTALKFGGSPGGYSAVGQQPEFVDMILNDPYFVHRELALMLARTCHELESLVTPKRLLYQLSQVIRRKLVRRGINPARVRFWKRRGWHIKIWRQTHKLDSSR